MIGSADAAMQDVRMAATLSEHLEQALRQWQPPALAVALSGGIDSSALLHALAALPAARALGLRALHVDHGLHAQSADWAERCAELCSSLGLSLQTLRCTVPRDGGRGIEAAAREARYASLAAAMQAGEWLLTAHHREDQAETVLLRLLRASGGAGLSAMRTTRPLGAGTLWRPLLDCPRDALRAHAESHQLRWIEDPANHDPQHDRSWLRQTLMPLLRERWPQADGALAQSARLLAADAGLIDGLTAAALAEARGSCANVLRIDALLRLEPALRAHVLRRWLREAGAAPLPAQQHARVETELIGAADGAQPLLRVGSTLLRRYRGELHVQTQIQTHEAHPDIEWDGRTPLSLADGGRLWFDPIWAGDVLRVGYRRGGERIRLPGRSHRHLLKNLLQDLGVPAWQRAQLPLIHDAQGVLLAVADRLVSAELEAACRDSGARLHWAPGATS